MVWKRQSGVWKLVKTRTRSKKRWGTRWKTRDLLFAGKSGRKLNLKEVKKKLLPPKIDQGLYDL